MHRPINSAKPSITSSGTLQFCNASVRWKRAFVILLCWFCLFDLFIFLLFWSFTFSCLAAVSLSAETSVNDRMANAGLYFFEYVGCCNCVRHLAAASANSEGKQNRQNGGWWLRWPFRVKTFWRWNGRREKKKIRIIILGEAKWDETFKSTQMGKWEKCTQREKNAMTVNAMSNRETI